MRNDFQLVAKIIPEPVFKNEEDYEAFYQRFVQSVSESERIQLEQLQAIHRSELERVQKELHSLRDAVLLYESAQTNTEAEQAHVTMLAALEATKGL